MSNKQAVQTVKGPIYETATEWQKEERYETSGIN